VNLSKEITGFLGNFMKINTACLKKIGNAPNVQVWIFLKKIINRTFLIEVSGRTMLGALEIRVSVSHAKSDQM